MKMLQTLAVLQQAGVIHSYSNDFDTGHPRAGSHLHEQLFTSLEKKVLLQPMKTIQGMGNARVRHSCQAGRPHHRMQHAH
jgi:hypothetical protein